MRAPTPTGPTWRVACLLIALGVSACDAGLAPRSGADGAAERDAAVIDAAVIDATVADGATAPIDGSIDAGAAPIDAGPIPGDAGARDGGGCVPGECCYETVETRAGVFHAVTESAPQLVVRPLEAGEGFFCLRASYTMRTVDNLATTDAAYEGCPIYSHVATVAGSTAAGRVLGTAYFRFLRLGCGARRPGALELDAYSTAGTGNQTLTGPWLPGETYRVVQEIRPWTSSIQLYALDGTPVGPRVEVDITGATVEMTRDTEIAFGLDRVYENAFFPYFDAEYSDLVVEADVAEAP